MPVHIFEITTPGTWLDYPDAEWVSRISVLLRQLQEHFYEANAALNLFEEAGALQAPRFDRERWQADANRRSEIRDQVESELGRASTPESWDRISYETEVRFKREHWSQGHVPAELERHVVPILARAFLYALDGFERLLSVLAKEQNVPPRVAELAREIAVLFPDLRGVRNTTQHLEDRARGLGAGKNSAPMQLQPVDCPAISAPSGGVLLLNILNGNRFGCTMSDGRYGEVEVSHMSLHGLQRILQETLQCFAWRGPRQHAPCA